MSLDDLPDGYERSVPKEPAKLRDGEHRDDVNTHARRNAEQIRLWEEEAARTEGDE